MPLLKELQSRRTAFMHLNFVQVMLFLLGVSSATCGHAQGDTQAGAAGGDRQSLDSPLSDDAPPVQSSAPQGQPTTEPTTQSKPQPAPVARPETIPLPPSTAAEPAASQPAIEEVVVTVSKRKESLQDVMGAVSAFSGETLKHNNVQNFNSLVQLMPNVVAQDEDKISIRGVSRTRSGPSPVAFHVNDVFIGQRGEEFYDLSDVEVLRGPSGTLFGRNATAGAINVKWHPPTHEFETGGTFRYSVADRQAQAYLNIPLLGQGDRRLLSRFAFMNIQNVEGTLHNLEVTKHHNPGTGDTGFARMYLTGEPTDNLKWSLRAVDRRNRAFAGSVASPDLHTRATGAETQLGAQPLPDDVTVVRSTLHDYFGDTADQFNRIDGDLTWSLHDVPLLHDFDVVVVGGQMHDHNRTPFDLDGTDIAIAKGRIDTFRDMRRTAEIRLVSPKGSGFDWLLGLFYYKNTIVDNLTVRARTYITPSTLNSNFNLIPPSLQPSIPQDVEIDFIGQHTLDRSRAAFLNLDFDLLKLLDWPNITITLGVRQNQDKFSLRTDDEDIYFLLPAGQRINAVHQANTLQAARFGATTGEAGARWFLTESGMVYMKVSRGYKPGLAQTIALPNGSIVQNPVNPEYLFAQEIGWKTDFFERALSLNLAAFNYDYSGLQVSQIEPGGVVTQNAASATIDGLEVESQWQPTSALRIQGSAGWLRAIYNKYCGSDPTVSNPPVAPGCTSSNPQSFAGDTLTAAPRYSASLLASYRWSLDSYGSLTPSIRSTWTDTVDRRGLGNEFDRVKPHSNSDARLTWTSPTGSVKVDAFVENIENHTNIFNQAYAPVIIGGRPDTFSLLNNLPPRIIGADLELQF